MLSYKYAGPTSIMYFTPWKSRDNIIRNSRRMPKPLKIDNNEYNSPIELSSSFHDTTSIHKFWEKHNETSEFKTNYTAFDVTRMFKNEGKCLSLNDSDGVLFATLVSYESDGYTYINGRLQRVRYIDGAVVNHKKKNTILKWLFSWMEYLYPSIYVYTSESLSDDICSYYTAYNSYAISTSFIHEDSTGDVERIPKSEFNKYQEMFIKKCKDELNFIYSLNSESSDVELYKVPLKFHTNSYYLVAVNNTKKTYKKYNIPVHEVIFCAIITANSIINPSDEEQYLTRYAIESVCKGGNYLMLIVSNKEASGDIYDYTSEWKKIPVNRKKLYIYNYLAKGSYNASIYFPR